MSPSRYLIFGAAFLALVAGFIMAFLAMVIDRVLRTVAARTGRERLESSEGTA